MSGWSFRAVFMFVFVAGVTPFLPICIRGLRVWACCLRRLRVFLLSMVSSVWRGGIYGLRRLAGVINVACYKGFLGFYLSGFIWS